MFKRRLNNKVSVCREFLSNDKYRLTTALVCIGIGGSLLASVYLKVPGQGGNHES